MERLSVFRWQERPLILINMREFLSPQRPFRDTPCHAISLFFRVSLFSPIAFFARAKVCERHKSRVLVDAMRVALRSAHMARRVQCARRARDGRRAVRRGASARYEMRVRGAFRPFSNERDAQREDSRARRGARERAQRVREVSARVRARAAQKEKALRHATPRFLLPFSFFLLAFAAGRMNICLGRRAE